MSYVNKINTVIHRFDNSDSSKFLYRQIYADTTTTITIDGNSVEILGGENPINFRGKVIVPNDTIVYLLGSPIISSPTNIGSISTNVIIDDVIDDIIDEGLSSEDNIVITTENGLVIIP